ncbi:LysR family glycine cleavage system transcriptional activator [Polaromonas sp. CG_9.5]|uniref:LysR substrate-binding domain-containing protein n=1 Tax=Polaromonas sp. CG_9.5 TaxID=3071705 RepID=UPI002E08BFE7|nr:LysR family glycine cleavage system transcriptional activator [Polaromonas sp. CG_9.5]
MQPATTHLRSRPIAAGQLRAFEAVARHLNFRAASEELALTQSAVSRQIQSLETDVGVSLFLRHTRAVELTSAGAQLLRALVPSLERIDSAVRMIRQSAGRKSVTISTWASFASMWLIPRLEAFQSENPDIDIRIDATDVSVDLETADVDLALRYAVPSQVPKQAQRLFGEQLTPVVSPWLLQSGPRLQNAQDLARFALIEASDAHRTQHMEWLSWQRWFDTQKLIRFEPKRWLYFNYAHQITQAALTGQGVALVRTPLIAESLSSGALVEPFPQLRLDSPLAYWLIVGPRNAARPEVLAFCDWLQAQAAKTREVIGETLHTEENSVCTTNKALGMV